MNEKQDGIYGNDSTIGLVNYLITLYNSTTIEYMYYPSKLNRLLTIYYLCILKYNKNYLDEDFIILDDGRMGYRTIIFDSLYERNDYKIRTKEDKSPILDVISYKDLENCEKELRIKLNREYEIISEIFKTDIQKRLVISDYSKKLLELIFRKFGNYSINDLGPLIDCIVLKLPLEKRNTRNYVECQKYDVFRVENNDEFRDNEVFEFIKNFESFELLKQLPTAKIKRLTNIKEVFYV